MSASRFFDLPPGIIVSQTDPGSIEGGYISAIRFELDPMPLSGGPLRGISGRRRHRSTAPSGTPDL